jgi:hypothetical protein
LALQTSLAQLGTQDLNVSRQHGQSHITLKSVEAKIEASIQSMIFKGVDRRFHCGMLMARLDEFFREFDLFFCFGKLVLIFKLNGLDFPDYFELIKPVSG